MTTEPATESPGPHGRTARHPVRVDTDGDFALDDLLALPANGAAWRINAAQATLARLWRLDGVNSAELVATSQPAVAGPDTPSENDVTLLHRFETSGLFRPPVREHVAALTPEVDAAWLALAARWIDLSRSCGDLRFLNTACKLTGAVWLHHHRTGSAIPAGAWREPRLTGQLGALGRLLEEAAEQLRQRLADRILLAESVAAGGEALSPVRLASKGRARIVVLASSGSRSAGRLVTAATAAGLPIKAVCWYTPSDAWPAVSSNYSSAWYPPAPPELAAAPDVPDDVPVTTSRSWNKVTAAILAADADHNQPIVASLHLARPAVDAGEVLAAHPVQVAPVGTLAARVRTTQLRLLLAGAAHVAATGALPDLTPQPATRTQFYRLHPHLKRLLDASPYAHDDHPQWRVIQP